MVQLLGWLDEVLLSPRTQYQSATSCWNPKDIARAVVGTGQVDELPRDSELAAGRAQVHVATRGSS